MRTRGSRPDPALAPPLLLGSPLQLGPSLHVGSPLRPEPARDHSRPDKARVLRICPNTILTATAMLSLLFTVQFGSLAALGFLVSGMLLCIRWPSRTMADLVRFWPIQLIPAWCILSALWSNEPELSLRLGIQLGLTFVIAVVMASRLSPKTFVRVALFAFGVAAIASLLFGHVRADGGGWTGIFGSKNEFAFAMSVLMLLSLATLLRLRGAGTRLLALAGLVLGGALLALGQSAGAFLSTGLAGLIGLGLVGLRHLPRAGRAVLFGISTLGLAALVLLAIEHRTALMGAVLDVTGKDVTLTGRTDLWAEGLREIAAYPFLGQGFQAFWVLGNPVAEAMWAAYGITSKSGFHFHNTWLSNAVEIGLVGVGLELAAFVATLVLVVRWAVARPTLGSVFFCMFIARQAVMSLVEVVAYVNFSVVTVLTIAALVYGLRARAEAAPVS